MPIQLACPGCSKQFRVADEHAGKKVKCPGCQTVFQVPLPQAEAPPPNFAAQPAASAPQPMADAQQPMHRPSPYAANPHAAQVGDAPPKPMGDELTESEKTMGNIGLALGIVSLLGEFFSGFGACCCGLLAFGVILMAIPAGVGLALSMKSAGGLKMAGIIVNGIALGLAALALVVIGLAMIFYGAMVFSMSQQNSGSGFQP